MAAAPPYAGAMLEQPTHTLLRTGKPNRLRGMAAGFARMPAAEKAALLAAWVLIGLSALVLRLVAFRRLAPLLGKTIGPNVFVPLIDARQTERALLIKRAVRRAACIAPFRSDCLPQALTGAVFCRILRVPATTCLGIRLGSETKIAAHAWVCAGAIRVTGGLSFDEYAVVTCFSTARLARAEAQAVPGPQSL